MNRYVSGKRHIEIRMIKQIAGTDRDEEGDHTSWGGWANRGLDLCLWITISDPFHLKIIPFP